jgi:hypothetical protein
MSPETVTVFFVCRRLLQGVAEVHWDIEYERNSWVSRKLGMRSSKF